MISVKPVAKPRAIGAPPKIDAVTDDSRLKNLAQAIDRLTERLRIAVIYGGDKSTPGAVIHPTHNPRGDKTYRTVAEDIANALGRLGFRHVYTLPEDMDLGNQLRTLGIDIAWLNSGGVQGYNPVCHLPAMMEMCGLSYVGHNPFNASILDNKHAFKRALQASGLPTATFMTWNHAHGPLEPSTDRGFQKTFAGYQGPFIVKPISGRASLHVHLVERANELEQAIADIYQRTKDRVLIEPYLPGREFVVSVCGPLVSRGRLLEKRREPLAFSISERVLGKDEPIFTSMDLRPITQDRVKLLDPSREPALVDELATLAKTIYREFDLETLVRIDLRADAKGRLFILEANPKPDLKRPSPEVLSLACAGLAQQGMDYDDLILSLLADRLDRLLLDQAFTGAAVARLLA